MKSIIKIKVLLSGKIIINDVQIISFEELQRALRKLKKEQSIIWFYRESAQFQANERAMEVFDFIVQNKFPISLSSKSDFSDYVDENGKSRPRQ